VERFGDRRRRLFLAAGHRVTVLDLYLYGAEVLDAVRNNPRLTEIKGDLRDSKAVARALDKCDAVIHLACISNDPSFELNPALGKSINYDCFRPLVRAAKKVGVKRFIYASSSSVYGIKEDPQVTEDLPLNPLTDYSKFKALCERVLEEEREPGFITCILRPSTVCGFAPRQRLDVVVNILTNHAVNTGRIRVFGGTQKRPNIHVEDMTDLYVAMLQYPDDLIDGRIYNAGYENHTLIELADIVKGVVGPNLSVDVEPTDDLRSYHVSSQRIKAELGFVAQRDIDDAVRGLANALRTGKLPDSMNDPRYFNIKLMQQVGLS
jgi:nucleoside-diphosphate-sugar epimerase